jgi:hypothetical protein
MRLQDALVGDVRLTLYLLRGGRVWSPLRRGMQLIYWMQARRINSAQTDYKTTYNE